MHYVTPDLCDAYPELVQVVEPMFSNFGGRDSFGGEIVTIKCFEDNSLVKEQVEKDGKGKVLVVDGGGSLRRALLVMHSPTDNTVGIANASQIFRAARHPRSFVSLEGADHLLTERNQARRAARIISAWADPYLT